MAHIKANVSRPYGQQGKRFFFDAMVIGSGLSACSFLLHFLKEKPDASVALVTKTNLGDGASKYAQGGLAASMQSGVASHIEDTLKAGSGLCILDAVTAIIEKSYEAIDYLTQSGVAFDRDQENNYLLAQEGGHSARRIYHCGDETGRYIMEALLRHVINHPQISIFEHHTAVNLITQANVTDSTNSEVFGAYILDEKADKIHTFLSNITVLATGGAGKTYRYTTNPEVSTGDGVAMAYRAGAQIENMEFYQFHPTLLHHPLINNFLISEAVRGEGAVLRSVDTGKRFMEGNGLGEELATRDIVARAIFNEIEQNHSSFVHLDMTHLSEDFIQKRFPNIYQTLLSIGINPAKDFIPVVPAAHYQCGGVATDIQGKTNLNRLYAIGEAGYTGLHGANRLASNSLLEAFVLGQNAAQACIFDENKAIEVLIAIEDWHSGTVINNRRASQINAHWRGLRGEMTSYAGIIRTHAGLTDVLELILIRKKIVEEYYWQHQITRDLIELRNIILNAELIVRGALLRKESRGGHYREDIY